MPLPKRLPLRCGSLGLVRRHQIHPGWHDRISAGNRTGECESEGYHQRDIADPLSGIGALAVAEGGPSRGARFFGMPEALHCRLAIGTSPPLRLDRLSLTG